ncbi:hypothetical protein TNCV_93791 [Trichonephila clavipes]|nr:hypothetical protein TNCV_93791 [Trichonephila clavipes]
MPWSLDWNCGSGSVATWINRSHTVVFFASRVISWNIVTTQTDLVACLHAACTRCSRPRLTTGVLLAPCHEQNRTVICMVLKAKANDRRKNSSP